MAEAARGERAQELGQTLRVVRLEEAVEVAEAGALARAARSSWPGRDRARRGVRPRGARRSSPRSAAGAIRSAGAAPPGRSGRARTGSCPGPRRRARAPVPRPSGPCRRTRPPGQSRRRPRRGTAPGARPAWSRTTCPSRSGPAPPCWRLGACRPRGRRRSAHRRACRSRRARLSGCRGRAARRGNSGRRRRCPKSSMWRPR